MAEKATREEKATMIETMPRGGIESGVKRRKSLNDEKTKTISVSWTGFIFGMVSSFCICCLSSCDIHSVRLDASDRKLVVDNSLTFRLKTFYSGNLNKYLDCPSNAFSNKDEFFGDMMENGGIRLEVNFQHNWF